jgi:hypothetical protein
MGEEVKEDAKHIDDHRLLFGSRIYGFNGCSTGSRSTSVTCRA